MFSGKGSNIRKGGEGRKGVGGQSPEKVELVSKTGHKKLKSQKKNWERLRKTTELLAGLYTFGLREEGRRDSRRSRLRNTE